MRDGFKDREHLLRMAALFVAGLAAFVVLRGVLVPADFGELGHYRSSVGAGRGRVLAQILTEVTVLALAGAAIGLVISIGTMRWFVTAIAADPPPFFITFGLDWRVLLFVAGLTSAATLFAGLLPALQATRLNVASTLKDEGRSATGFRAGRFTGALMGEGLIAGDPEGVALVRCPGGTGYWIATDQQPDVSWFRVFRRSDLAYLGAFRGQVTTNTDGVTFAEGEVPGFEEKDLNVTVLALPRPPRLLLRPPLPPRDPAERAAIAAAAAPVLERIAAEVRACRACGLCETRNQAVPGVGTALSGIVFVGEAPGEGGSWEGVACTGARDFATRRRRGQGPGRFLRIKSRSTGTCRGPTSRGSPSGSKADGGVRPPRSPSPPRRRRPARTAAA